MDLGLISYSPLLKRAIPASLKKPQSLQQTIRMRNKLVMSLMMTVMMLQHRKNMFQLDQRKKIKRKNKKIHCQKLLMIVKNMVDQDPMKDLVSLVN
jgi:hypothetical protein